MADHPAVHQVLQVCGIMVPGTCNIMIADGFDRLSCFAILETDEDVNKMAKRYASRPGPNHVYLTTIQVKYLQALCWWTRDCVKHVQALDAALFDEAVLQSALEQRQLRRLEGELWYKGSNGIA